MNNMERHQFNHDNASPRDEPEPIEPSEDQIARAVKNIRSDRNAVTELLTESPWIAEWADWMIDNNPAFRAEVELSKAVTDEAMRIAKADRESAALEAAIDGSECDE